jgi:AAA domain
MVPRVRLTPKKPDILHGDLDNAPVEITARDCWSLWKRELRDGKWTKPPYQSMRPDKYAKVDQPKAWGPFETARKAFEARAGDADGIGVNLLDAGVGALDLDHCRDPQSRSTDIWAKNVLDRAERLNAYIEITPTGTGYRVLGRATGGRVYRKFKIAGGREDAAIEIFRAAEKFITVTGNRVSAPRTSARLPNIDGLIDDLVAAYDATPKPAPKSSKGNGAAHAHDNRGVDWDAIIRDGEPEGEDRSQWFNRCAWHLKGIGLDRDGIIAELGEHPDGVARRYIAEERLAGEVDRCLKDYPNEETAESHRRRARAPLPTVYLHGDVDPFTSRKWRIKKLMTEVGVGLLVGQWGTYKTFMAVELAAAVMTGQSFADRFRVRQKCGVLLIATEGAEEVAPRLEAVVQEKCREHLTANRQGEQRAPFAFCKETPLLLQTGAADTLVAMAQEADRHLQAEFGLPLGLIIIDTVMVAAGYTKSGDENDSAIAQKVMSVLKTVAEQTHSFVLGVDHFGKNIETGTRGSSAKESHADCVLALLGKETDGRVTDPRINTRKVRGASAGQEFAFTVRTVELLRYNEAGQPQTATDEDGDPITTLVIEWPPQESGSLFKEWPKSLRLLQRVLVETISAHGVPLPVGDGIKVQAIDREEVRPEFYKLYPADGDTEQKRQRARKEAFKRTIKAAQDASRLDVRVVGETTYLWIKE